MNPEREGYVDVLVIGAGVAGATAALSAARAGCGSGGGRVMLVERSAWPREKVCGCCLGGRGVAALGGVGIERKTLLEVGYVLESAEVRCGARSAVLPLAGRAGGGVVVGRKELDGLLVARAVQAGVEFVPSCSARLAPQRGINGWLISLRTPMGERSVRAGVVIVADGLSGRSLDAVAGMGVRVASAARMGVGATARWGCVRDWAGRDALPVGRVVLCAGRGGYVGLVRLRDGGVDIAGALDPGMVKVGGGPGGVVEGMLRGAGLCVDGAMPEKFAGTALLTRRRSCIALPGLLVVGDSAGYVEPFTGEGMTWAACGGEMAGVLAMRESAEGAGGLWAGWHAENVRAKQGLCRAVSAGLRVPGLAGVVAWAVGRSPSARGFAERVALWVSGPGFGRGAHVATGTQGGLA